MTTGRWRLKHKMNAVVFVTEKCAIVTFALRQKLQVFLPQATSFASEYTCS
jgi:hypothetical protein